MRLRATALSLVCLVLTVGLSLGTLGCQSWDRLQPSDENSGGTAAGSASGQLTNDVAFQRMREINGAATPEERLSLIADFVGEYPRAQLILQLQIVSAEAHSALGDAASAAVAYERAILISGMDILELPHEADLAYKLGWALYQAGETERGVEWLVRTTFISDTPQLDQSLRYMHAEAGEAAESYDDWLAAAREEHAVQAPQFTLPGLRQEWLSLGEILGRVTLVDFWTPT